jgi:hypothetical protein
MSKTIDRRAILAGAASLPAISIPAIAAVTEPDPIHAAIEAHRAAWARLEDHLRKSTAEDEAEEERLNAVIADAEDGLSATEPTTIAGAVALLRYVVEHREMSSDHEFAAGALSILADALERMVQS